MSRIDKLSAELLLLSGDQLNAALDPALAAQKRELLKLGLVPRDAEICARAIVAAALVLADAIQTNSASFPAFKLTDLGVSAN